MCPVQRCADRIKWKYELQRIVEPKRTETFIPRGGSFVLCIDRESDASYFLSHGNRTLASGLTPQLLRNGHRSFRKSNRARAYRS